ncbi:hypothetical protein [Paraburkholderia kururiensis]|uniref:hypothetical protein n=1 Tax=Paraburkholderia kururiensis TaxID=984307 RepID=UPI0018F62145|nr:hypothetical protein [Paraburkholderia kururiensis]
METNWNLIREVINTAIDSCEKLEQVGYAEQHRGITIDVGGQRASVQDFLVSAWTLAENARYEVIRERHDHGLDLPYVPETSRILVAVAAACAELVGAGKSPPAETFMRGMIDWYRNHFDAHVGKAISS